MLTLRYKYPAQCWPVNTNKNKPSELDIPECVHELVMFSRECVRNNCGNINISFLCTSTLVIGVEISKKIYSFLIFYSHLIIGHIFEMKLFDWWNFCEISQKAKILIHEISWNFTKFQNTEISPVKFQNTRIDQSVQKTWSKGRNFYFGQTHSTVDTIHCGLGN